MVCAQRIHQEVELGEFHPFLAFVHRQCRGLRGRSCRVRLVSLGEGLRRMPPVLALAKVGFSAAARLESAAQLRVRLGLGAALGTSLSTCVSVIPLECGARMLRCLRLGLLADAKRKDFSALGEDQRCSN